MDSSTISAFAAAGAAGAATLVAGIQFFVGYRQSNAALTTAQAAMMTAESSGRHTVATFRQKWIETVRETLSEYHSILMSDGNDYIGPEDARKLAALRTKLQLLLNPSEPASNDLLHLIDEVRASPSSERVVKDATLSQLAQKILKTEWVRIKDELTKREPAQK